MAFQILYVFATMWARLWMAGLEGVMMVLHMVTQLTFQGKAGATADTGVEARVLPVPDVGSEWGLPIGGLADLPADTHRWYPIFVRDSSFDSRM